MQQKNTNEITVFIVDDDTQIRQSLQWLFESMHFSVKCYNSASNFLDNYSPLFRGCLILDVRMPNMSGLELLEELKSRNNHLPVIIITGHGDVPMAVRAMKAGAIDFISKPFNDQELLEKIQHAILKNTKNVAIDTSKYLASLTARERDVLNLVIDGKKNKQISEELGIAISTVQLHRAKVMEKMHVKNIAQLVKICLLTP